jgi:hypothetical protein
MIVEARRLSSFAERATRIMRSTRNIRNSVAIAYLVNNRHQDEEKVEVVPPVSGSVPATGCSHRSVFYGKVVLGPVCRDLEGGFYGEGYREEPIR